MFECSNNLISFHFSGKSLDEKRDTPYTGQRYWEERGGQEYFKDNGWGWSWLCILWLRDIEGYWRILKDLISKTLNDLISKMLDDMLWLVKCSMIWWVNFW